MIDKIKEILKTSLIYIIIIILFIYLIIVFFRYKDRSDIINENGIKLEQLDLNIKRENIKNEKSGNLNIDYRNKLYFIKDTEYFDYVRNIFKKYNINVNIYQSKGNSSSNNYEISVNFVINSIDFFKIINEIEKGEKFLAIKNLTVRKDTNARLKISMKIVGYYK